MIAFAFILLGVTSLASAGCGVVGMLTGNEVALTYQRQFFANTLVLFAAALLAVVA